MLNRQSRKGSLSLEAALVLPVILLLLLSFLGLQSAITAEIKLKGALDRTAAELALLSPMAQAVGPILADNDASNGTGHDGESVSGTPLIDDLEHVVGEIIP